MLLANWFEISDQDYIWYTLQGYTIDADENRVIWILDGKYHREDGPAYIGADGAREWYLNGKRVTEAEVKLCTAYPPYAIIL
jgi:hypothetical protein